VSAVTASPPREGAPVARPQAATPARSAAPVEEAPPWEDVPFETDEPSAPARPPRIDPPAAAPVPAPVRSALGDRWAQVVEQMVQQGSIAALVRELAMQAQCTAIAKDGATTVCRLRVERETLRAASQCDKLQAALAQLLDHAVRLEVEAGVAEDSPALRAAAERERRQREAEQIIHNDPLVQALMAQYKTARIVPGSIKPH
jgi:DNA polymerase-3 subunit gamma/tau